MQPDTSAPDSAATTEQRLIDAALEVFSREGIAKATTREIAKVAGVNEVTLFRKFQTKQRLLEEVLSRAFLPAGGKSETRPSIAKGDSVETVIRHFAKADFERKKDHTGLMRVLVAESHRMGELETEMLRRIFLPWKQELANQLREAAELGLVRADVVPQLIVDQLMGMLFVGALRCEARQVIGYTPDEYLDGCVDLILRGLTPDPA
jgi:AcrR family transcriptional regulator